MKKKRIWIFLAIIVIIILVIIAASQKKGTGSIKITTEEATIRTLTETVAANGKIQPETEVKISPYISGEVVELYVKEGDKVNNGDLLGKIDPEIYISNYERMEASVQTQKANLANAKARLAQTKAQLFKAEEDFKRNKTLFEQNVISQSEFDAAKSSFEVSREEVKAAEENVRAAEFTVSSAQASLREANENLTRTAIYAPNNGIISKLNVEKGERVTGASQFSSGTEIMRIANLDRMVVNVEVNENDIVRVSLFDTCTIEVDAYLNKKFKGIVTEIATSANVTGISADQVTNFEVKILILPKSYSDLVNEDDFIRSPFRPGMSATVDIQTETAPDILTVPIQAVTTRVDSTQQKKDESEEVNNESKDELKEFVFLYKDGKAIFTKVKSGIQDSRYIEIKEGVSEGEEVITGPYRAVSKRLKDGDEVKKVKKDDLFKED
ncbi:MAG: efflux RND transporter periplasmic adaptor subunit [Bacteroidales bacterium]|nr:efflux RND transporter periplasmic adaptor subunit [Bacteroidales bacterium]